MKMHHATSTGTQFDFDSAIKHASVIAFDLPGNNMFWCDQEHDFESPAHVGKCHEGCATRGSRDCALNCCTVLAVDRDDGCFVCCFRLLDGFVPVQ